MSYTRDPDHYTRGVGAVQAVDKVLARHRGRARQLGDAANESARRDRLKAKLMRPALGAVKLPTFGRTGSNMAPVLTAGGLVEGGGTIGGGGAVNTGGTFGSGGGGGGVSPTNGGGVKGRTFTLALNAANTGVMQPMQPPTYVGICVDAMGNKIPCPAPASGGPAWNPNSGIVPPVLPPSSSSSSGLPTGGPSGVMTTDPGSTPTSSVGTVSGGSAGGGATGPSGVMTTIDPTDGSVNTDNTVLTPTAPDYKTYALYGGIALGALLLYRELTRKGR